jgi:Tfp pilus assembly PilM family ATPase/Tfp pilus assembly protein PilN
MGFSQSSLGIDLREDRIIFSHLKRSFKHVRVTNSSVVAFAPGDKSKDEREAEIINAVQKFITTQNVSRDNVFIAFPRERALLKILEIPSAVKENLRKAIEYDIGKYIPFPTEDAAFDYQVLNERGGTLRVLLVAVRSEDLNEYLGLFKRIGVKPLGVEISSTACANLLYYDQSQVNARPFVLLDIRRQFFEFHFFENGNFMETVHSAFNDEKARVEEVAEAFGLAQLKAGGPDGAGRTLLVYGEEIDDSFLGELGQKLSVDLPGGPLLKRIQAGNGSQNTYESLPSIGLALRGVSKTRWNLNLLPQSLRKKVSRVGLYAAIFLTLICIGLGGALFVRPFLQEREELKRLSAEVKEHKPKVDAIETVQKKREKVEKEVQEFNSLISEGSSRLEVLKELSEVLPPTVWIWNLKLRSRDVELNGYANSASDLIAILDKSPYFEKVEFTSPVTKERRLLPDQTEKERFKINAKIERGK